MLWYETKNIGCVISTRVRLARNLEGVPFPSKLPLVKLREVNEQIADAVDKCDFGVKLRKVQMETIGEYEIYSMVERHIISPKFANVREGRILYVSDDEHLSIMIGEEDHLRIQVLNSGFCLKDTYELCDKIDTLLSQKLKFAFDEKLGYLTECPTNLGTGMRASLMLHLPVLNSTGELKKIAGSVSKIGLTFRGFYGEGSNSRANFYQLSNQVTLGISEFDALENLKNIATQIVDKENALSDKIDGLWLADNVYRSFGILKYARKISTDEMMQHISMLMFGERKKAVFLPENINLMNLFIISQPAMIKRIHGEKEPAQRDKIRADILRNAFASVEI